MPLWWCYLLSYRGKKIDRLTRAQGKPYNTPPATGEGRGDRQAEKAKKLVISRLSRAEMQGGGPRRKARLFLPRRDPLSLARMSLPGNA